MGRAPGLALKRLGDHRLDVCGVAVVLVLPPIGLLFTLVQLNVVEKTSMPSPMPSTDEDEQARRPQPPDADGAACTSGRRVGGLSGRTEARIRPECTRQCARIVRFVCEVVARSTIAATRPAPSDASDGAGVRSRGRRRAVPEPDGVEERGAKVGLPQDLLCAARQGLLRELLGGHGADQRHDGGWMPVLERGRCGHSAHPGHVDVHQDEFGPAVLGHLEGVLARRGLADQSQELRAPHEDPQRAEERVVVVDRQDPGPSNGIETIA
jgi:hypothetical protein